MTISCFCKRFRLCKTGIARPNTTRLRKFPRCSPCHERTFRSICQCGMSSRSSRLHKMRRLVSACHVLIVGSKPVVRRPTMFRRARKRGCKLLLNTCSLHDGVVVELERNPEQIALCSRLAMLSFSASSPTANAAPLLPTSIVFRCSSFLTRSNFSIGRYPGAVFQTFDGIV